MMTTNLSSPALVDSHVASFMSLDFSAGDMPAQTSRLALKPLPPGNRIKPEPYFYSASRRALSGLVESMGLPRQCVDLAMRSPTLRHDLFEAAKQGVNIVFGPAGGGSYFENSRTIVLDAKFQNDANALTRILAHEAGHVARGPAPDESSEGAFVASMLEEEGCAVLDAMLVQREILVNGGPDIGIGANTASWPHYNAIVDQYMVDGDARAASQAIGEYLGDHEITSNTGQVYRDYYSKDYRRRHGMDDQGFDPMMSSTRTALMASYPPLDAAAILRSGLILH